MTPAQRTIIIADSVITALCLITFFASMFAIIRGAWWNVIFAAGSAYLAFTFADDIRSIHHTSHHT